MSVPHIVAKCGDDIVLAEVEALKSRAETHCKTYVCDFCKNTLDLRRTQHPRYTVTAFFAHKSVNSTCTGGSKESLQHLEAKFWLKHFVGHYNLCLHKCPTCGPVSFFESKTDDIVDLEVPQRIEGKTYVYDTVIAREWKVLSDDGCSAKDRIELLTNTGHEGLIIEVFHTHKTEEGKIENIRKNGLQVAEVEAETVLKLVPELKRAQSAGTQVNIPNLLKSKVECDACGARNALLRAEQNAARLQELETLRERGMTLAKSFMLSRKNKKTDKYEYKRFSSQKCCECKRWKPFGDIRSCPRWVWSEEEFASKHAWFVTHKKKLPEWGRVCSRCVVDCVSCYTPFPIQKAVTHGLCVQCDAEFTRLEKNKISD